MTDHPERTPFTPPDEPPAGGVRRVVAMCRDTGFQLPASAGAVVLVDEDGVGRWEGPWQISVGERDGEPTIRLRRV